MVSACGDNCDANCKESAAYLSPATNQAALKCNHFDGDVHIEKVPDRDGILLVCRCKQYR